MARCAWVVATVLAAGISAHAVGGGELCRMQAPEGLIAHEWGTFTSFSTPDGKLLYFGTAVADRLPDFVYTRQRQFAADPGLPAVGAPKSEFWARQRMETPVIYFYAPKAMSVDVRVDFPQGLMTEFYPPVTLFGPSTSLDRERPPRDGALEWRGVGLTPGTTGAQAPPEVTNGSHYATARDVAPAAGVHCSHLGSEHVEKFLFYRGVGDFEMPITIRALGQDRFELACSRKEQWPGGLLVSIEDGKLRWRAVGALAGSLRLDLAGAGADAAQAAEALVRSLHQAGLFELEARAMVDTWRRSWFAENGTRFLAIMPPALCDELLPLRITPTPVETRRVFVARLEVLTPEVGARIEKVAGEGPGDAPRVSERLRREFGWLGRFYQPALDSRREATTNPDVRRRLGG